MNNTSRDWTDLNFLANMLTEIAEAGGNISEACRNMAVNRDSFYKLTRLNPDEHEGAKFIQENLPEAIEMGKEALVDEARRRAFSGVREPVIFMGRVSYQVNPVTTEIEPVTVTKFSDRLLMFLLGGLDRRFAKKHELTGKDGTPLGIATLDLSKAEEGDLDKLIALGETLLAKEDDG